MNFIFYREIKANALISCSDGEFTQLISFDTLNYNKFKFHKCEGKVKVFTVLEIRSVSQYFTDSLSKQSVPITAFSMILIRI